MSNHNKKHNALSYFSQKKHHTPQENTWIARINKGMAWCFYAIFFSVPLVMYPTTFELFEFNKMWITFLLSLIVLFLWLSKILIEQKLFIRRTPLDIPILLFLASQIISTFISLDPHVSFWGYYSRFNGGLLSTITYIFLYYAFASNLITTTNEEVEQKPFSYRLLLASFFSGIVVALWGFPSHFGYDPTCFVFRGALDVSCWTDAFHPTVRIFSTLGQPNWMAIYMAILIPISCAFVIYKLKEQSFFVGLLYALASILLYVDLLFTRSQSGIAGFWIGQFVFFVIMVFLNRRTITSLVTEKSSTPVVLLPIVFLVFTFFIGTGIPQVDRFTYKEVRTSLFPTKSASITPNENAQKSETQQAAPAQEFGGTDSGRIRKIVWTGALEIFKNNVLTGTGVETFAYAYYKVKPKEHNLTSEWDYLYNKAHNEYLNYLATTGAFGLGSYLLIIGVFLISAVRLFIKKIHSEYVIFSAALIGSYIAILVSNFFGFSVVIVNLFFFLIPIMIYDLIGKSLFKQKVFEFGNTAEAAYEVSGAKWTGIAVIGIVILYLQFLLLTFWLADKKYALGFNLNKAGQFVQANTPLTEAVQLRPGEDVFKDELSSNLATLSLLFAQQGQATQAGQLALQAKQLSDEVVSKHPNNVVFYKTRTRVLYVLAQMDTKYIADALDTIQKASALAPTDAKIMYNLALLYDQAGQREKAIEVLQKTIEVKPNYRDPYYALAVYYAEMSKEHEKENPSKAKEEKDLARKYLEYTLKNIVPDDQQAKDLLNTL